MNCNRVQCILSVPPERRNRWHRLPPLWATPYFWAIMHATSCADCAAFTTRLRSLDAQIARWKSDTALVDVPEGFQTRVSCALGDALRDRAASALLEKPAPKKRKRIMSLLPLAAATTVVVGGALVVPFLMSAPHQESQTLPAVQPISPAISPVTSPEHSVYVSTWTLDSNGKLRREEEMWHKPSHWRKEGVYGSRLIVAGAGYPTTDARSGKTVYGTYYRYDSVQRKVTAMAEVGEQPTRFTVDTLVSTDALAAATVVGEERRDGKIVREYQIDDGATARTLLWVDAARSLPVRYERATKSEDAGAAWVTNFRQEFAFDQPLPESLFDPNNLKDEGWRK